MIDFGSRGRELAMAFLKENILENSTYGSVVGNFAVFTDIVGKNPSITCELTLKYANTMTGHRS